jgi:RNA polymerase sigma factor (TIGR02999 family)
MASEPGRSDDRRVATLLLERTRRGDAGAAQELLGVVYEELRALAASFFGSPNPRHTLQPTALVHEAYMKLVNAPNQEWEGRRHFVAVAAKAMRQILANHARDKRASKRGGGACMVTLDGGSGDGGGPADRKGGLPVVEALALEEAMERLEAVDPEQCRIVELRYFAGLSVEETALVLGVSDRTVNREWRMAKAQLLVWLGDGAAG